MANFFQDLVEKFNLAYPQEFVTSETPVIKQAQQLKTGTENFFKPLVESFATEAPKAAKAFTGVLTEPILPTAQIIKGVAEGTQPLPSLAEIPENIRKSVEEKGRILIEGFSPNATKEQFTKAANLTAMTAIGFIAPEEGAIEKGIKPIVKSELQPLAEEAMKYKSAEDFIESVRRETIKKIETRPEQLKNYLESVKDIPENKLANKTSELLNKFDTSKRGWFDKAIDFYNQVTKTVEPKVRPEIEPALSGTILPEQKLSSQLETPSLPESIAPPIEPVKPPTGRGGITPPELNLSEWKDKGAFSLTRETLERNLEDVAGKDSSKAKEFIVDPIRNNEESRIVFNNQLRTETEDRIIKELGIKKGSEEDALIQAFGEGSIDEIQLRKLSPNKWQEIKTANNFFRQKYDQLLSLVNDVRAQFGYNPIPKRQDYFRHFQELDGIIKNFGLIFREQDLPTELSGLTEFFKPGKPFSTAELQRKGGKFTLSAIKGFDEYIDSISKQIFHIDSVQRARTLEKYIREAGEEGQAKLPNFVANLKEYGNNLAGKKSTFDRAFESLFGRKFYITMNEIKKRTSANMVGANVSSALTNFIPFTQLVATTEKPSVIRGVLDAVSSPFQKDFNHIGGTVSSFLTRRYPIERIGATFGEGTKDVANWLFQTIDKFTAKSVVASKYYEGISKGLVPEEAMKIADNYAGRVLTDRSLGQLPNLFNVKTIGPITQFQTEINNAYSFLVKDIPQMSEGNKLKVISSLGQFTLYSYIFNNVFEQVTGRRPTIDPIHFVITSANELESKRDKKIGTIMDTLQQDILSNLPIIGGITGGRFPISAGFPDIPGWMQGKTTIGKEALKSAFFLGPKFGGLQAKKTLEGLSAFATGKVKSKTGKTTLFREAKTPENLLRNVLFGKWSTPEARKYFEKRK